MAAQSVDLEIEAQPGRFLFVSSTLDYDSASHPPWKPLPQLSALSSLPLGGQPLWTWSDDPGPYYHPAASLSAMTVTIRTRNLMWCKMLSTSMQQLH